MKKIILSFLLLSTLFLVSCGKKQEENPDNPTYDNYEELFKGDWNKPGLYNKDGSEHIMPEMIEKTGITIDVTQFGAKPNDPSHDNHQAFKSAIDAAMEGDEVYVPIGSYYFKGAVNQGPYYSHIHLKSNIIFRGESQEDTILISEFSEHANQNRETTVVSLINSQNVVIENMTISSKTPDNKLPDPNNSGAQSNIFTGPKYGVSLETNGAITDINEQTSNVVVQNVTIEKFQRMAVRVKQTREVTIDSITVQKALNLGGGGAGYGVSIQGSGFEADWTGSTKDTVWNVVKNSKFVGPYLRHGVLIQYYAHNNAVLKNEFEGVLLDSIDLHGEDEYSNEIAFNIIKNTRAGAGVGVGNSGATHDASGRNNYIHDNVIDGGRRGIDIILGSPKTIVVNNEIKNLEQPKSIGITISNAPYTFIVNNKLTNIKSTDEGYGVKVSYAYNALDPNAGIPNYLNIVGNHFEDVSKGVFVETHGDVFEYKDNTFKGILEYEYLNTKDQFVVPERSELMDPVYGYEIIAMDANFITTEDPKNVQSQKNMKFKTSIIEPNYNRMIYAKFDVTEKPEVYEKVYLSFTAKAQYGKPVINIFGSTTYVDWETNTITWDNSRLHAKNLAVIEYDKEVDQVDKVYDFEFPVAVYDFNTYYIDVTDYVEGLKANIFTLVFTNEAIDEVYMEIYNHLQVASKQHLRLIFK